MSRHLPAVALLALAVTLVSRDATAVEDAPEERPWAAVQKDARKAFKPLKLPSAKKLRKQVEPDLPAGIVIESGPFDRLIARLGEPFEEQLALRESVVSEMSAHPGAKAGKELRAAFVTLGKEDAELAERVADFAAEYAEVFDQGYMAAGESTRRTRKLAATLIPFYRGLRRRNDELRERAAASLASFTAGEAFDWLVAAARDKDPAVRAAVVEGLGHVRGEAEVAALRRVLRTDAEPGIRLTALCALLRSPVQDVVADVLEALGDPAWEVRAVAIAACVHGRLVEAAKPLIDALAKEDARLRTDIDDALHALVGARYYGDVALWRKWWDDNADQVEQKARELREAGAYAEAIGPPESWEATERAAGSESGGAGQNRQRGVTSAFYGIATRSRRVLFVVDISRSMESPAKAIPPKTGEPGGAFAAPQGSSKMAIAVWQLHRAVEELPDDARFNVAVYSESYAVWNEGMSDASAKAKKKAHAFVDGVTANGVTNICDSLDAAFELAGVGGWVAGGARTKDGYAADTIYLLSDGDPNRGRVADLDRLIEDVVRRTARARLVIHTVGIGEVAGSSFLQALARRTGGQYVGFE